MNNKKLNKKEFELERDYMGIGYTEEYTENLFEKAYMDTMKDYIKMYGLGEWRKEFIMERV
jgi:hypothetical protein